MVEASIQDIDRVGPTERESLTDTPKRDQGPVAPMPMPESILPADDLEIVCLPDLFLDHVIHLPEIDEVEATIRSTYAQGGGKVLDVPQQVIPGGNAANTAYALSRLGVRARLVGRTSPRGLAFFEATMGAEGVDMELVADDGEMAATTVLAYGPEGTNVMLNDPGSVEDYGREDMTPAIEEAIGAADAVLVGNWASMTQHGTELVRHVAQIASEADTFSYFDASDPSRRDDEEELIEAIADSPLDAWAMNDAEVAIFTGQSDIATAAGQLADRTGTRIDVHDADHAVSVGPNGKATARTFDVDPIHLTGAGDAFNAGNLVAELAGLKPEKRLRFAHAIAAATIAHPDATPPGPEDVQRQWKLAGSG